MAAVANLSKLNPRLKTIARNLPRAAARLGFQVRITSGYRSYATQAKLYNDYRRGISHYPANPPGRSEHERGNAIDVVSTDLEKLVTLLTSVGLIWAGPGDNIHFQIGKQALKSPQTAFKTKGKGSGGKFVKNALGVVSWVPGPIGWAASLVDFIL